MHPHTTAGEFSISDVHRAIDQLTILRIRLQHLARHHAAGESIDPAVFHELVDLTSALAPALLDCRDHHRDASNGRVPHPAGPAPVAPSPRPTSCLHAAP